MQNIYSLCAPSIVPNIWLNHRQFCRKLYASMKTRIVNRELQWGQISFINSNVELGLRTNATNFKNKKGCWSHIIRAIKNILTILNNMFKVPLVLQSILFKFLNRESQLVGEGVCEHEKYIRKTLEIALYSSIAHT